MVNEYKEVRFDLYCKDCKHKEVSGNDEPCDECLSEPLNYASVKPVKFEEKE